MGVHRGESGGDLEGRRRWRLKGSNPLSPLLTEAVWTVVEATAAASRKRRKKSSGRGD